MGTKKAPFHTRLTKCAMPIYENNNCSLLEYNTAVNCALIHPSDILCARLDHLIAVGVLRRLLEYLAPPSHGKPALDTRFLDQP